MNFFMHFKWNLLCGIRVKTEESFSVGIILLTNPGGPASLYLKTDKPSSYIDGHNQARLSQKQSEHSLWIDSLAKALHSGDFCR